MRKTKLLLFLKKLAHLWCFRSKESYNLFLIAFPINIDSNCHSARRCRIPFAHPVYPISSMRMLKPPPLLIFRSDIPLNYLSSHVQRRCRKERKKFHLSSAEFVFALSDYPTFNIVKATRDHRVRYSAYGAVAPLDRMAAKWATRGYRLFMHMYTGGSKVRLGGDPSRSPTVTCANNDNPRLF